MATIAELVDFIFPHNPKGKGVRPIDDESLQFVREAIKKGGPGSEVVQKAVKSNERVTLTSGPKGLWYTLMDALDRATSAPNTYTVGNYYDTGRRIQLNPKAAKATGTDIPGSTLPHETAHFLRDVLGKNTGDPGIEEPIARLAAGDPVSDIRKYVSGLNEEKLAKMRLSLEETLALADALNKGEQ